MGHTLADQTPEESSTASSATTEAYGHHATAEGIAWHRPDNEGQSGSPVDPNASS